jgi:hypothetical protein
MRTQHFFIFTLVFLFSLPVAMTAQNHSIIVDMNEKGPTTPKPRSLTRFSSSAYEGTASRTAEAPGVWIDLEKKEMCVRYLNPEEECVLIVTNDNGSYQLCAPVVSDGEVNLYLLSDMNKPGRYSVTVQTPDACYQGYYTFSDPTTERL